MFSTYSSYLKSEYKYCNELKVLCEWCDELEILLYDKTQISLTDLPDSIDIETLYDEDYDPEQACEFIIDNLELDEEE
jgi:hypothetical protein